MHLKRLTAAAFATALFTGLPCQTGHAQGLLNESGQATLADAFGTATGPEALTVGWSVVENSSDIYTYSYIVQNPTGDLLLNGDGSPTSTSEIVDAFSVQFDATIPGAYQAGTQTGGLTDQDNGVAGLSWSFAAVNPGGSSPSLSFQSVLAPGLGNANATDDNPPSPWRSTPGGQQVPVPLAVPEPDTLALVAGALLMMPFRRAVGRFIRPGGSAIPPADGTH